MFSLQKVIHGDQPFGSTCTHVSYLFISTPTVERLEGAGFEKKRMFHTEQQRYVDILYSFAI